MLINFDFAITAMTNGKRHLTTVPQQALFFMNNPLVVEQSKKLVARPDFRKLKAGRDRTSLLYELIYQRPPTEEEISLGLEFVADEPSREKVMLVATVTPARPTNGPPDSAKQPLRRATGRPPRAPTAVGETAHPPPPIDSTPRVGC